MKIPFMFRRLRWRILGGLCGLVVLSIFALWISSVHEGQSMQARAIVLLLRAIGARHSMQTVTAFEAAVAEDRRRGEAPPPDALRRRYLISRQALDGGAVYTLVPRAMPNPERSLIFIHGGAYCGATNDGHWNFVGKIGERTGVRIVLPQYPLAPEHDWKPAYAMLGHLYAQLLADGPSSSITIAGDSAGGGLALGFAEALRDEGKPMPGGLVLMSPWLNLVQDNPAQAALEERDPALSRVGLEWAAMQWANGTPLGDPHISPVLGSLRGLPPILLFSGTMDLLNADARQLVEKARHDGAQLDYREVPNMFHDWMLAPVPEAKSADSGAVAFILRAP